MVVWPLITSLNVAGDLWKQNDLSVKQQISGRRKLWIKNFSWSEKEQVQQAEVRPGNKDLIIALSWLLLVQTNWCKHDTAVHSPGGCTCFVSASSSTGSWSCKGRNLLQVRSHSHMSNRNMCGYFLQLRSGVCCRNHNTPAPGPQQSPRRAGHWGPCLAAQTESPWAHCYTQQNVVGLMSTHGQHRLPKNSCCPSLIQKAMLPKPEMLVK